MEMDLPTFDEFKRNRDFYMKKFYGTEEDTLAWADAGSTMLKEYVQRHVYEIEGYRCKSLEEVERIARQQGIALKDLDYKPVIVPQAGRKCDLLVKFMSKSQREKREL
jgi:hypothetical protein